MKRLHTFTVVSLVTAITTVASAQTPAAPASADAIRLATAREIQADGRDFNVDRDSDYLVVVVARSRLVLKLLQQYEEERSDEQVGATSSSSGTTTLTSKGTVPQILGFAVENGAMTQSQSGTTVTFRTNVGGAIGALAKKGLLQLANPDDPGLKILNRIAFSASFDTSRGTNGSADTFTGDQQQLSQWTARVQLLNRRDPQGAHALEEWTAQLQGLLGNLAREVGPLHQAFAADPAVSAWVQETVSAVRAGRSKAEAEMAARPAAERSEAVAQAIASVLRAREGSFPADAELLPATKLALVQFDGAASAFTKGRHQVLQEVAAGGLVTVEYSNDRPVKAPHTSNVRLVGEVGSTVDLSGNISMTLFDEIPMGASQRVRDFQMSGQLDFKLGSADTVGAFIVSLSGKYLRQFENSYSDAGVMVPDTKGTTAIGQLKLTIPAGKGTGAKIPLSITFANRTDLIKESIVRANIGITYDLDSLFAKLRP